MALTKVSGGILDPGINVAGIVTATGFDGPFTGGSSKNITAGVVTATSLDLNGNGDISGNLVIGGNLTANGDFTTLNTTLREVELLRVDAQNDNVAAGIITQRGSGDILNLYDNTTEVFSVEDGGKVKIGMGLLGTNTSDYDAAANNLIVGTGSGDEGITILSGQSVGHHGSIFFADGTGATNSKRGQIRYEQNSERMKFFTAGTQKLTIDINGKVGIGTDIPAEKLSVEDSSPAILINATSATGESKLQFGRLGNTNIGEIKYEHSNNAFTFRTNDGADRLRIDSNGRVGIGTDPYYKLSVNFNNSNTELSGGGSGNWGSDGLRLENENTTVGSMSLVHFRTGNHADWHIGGKFVGNNSSNFVFIHESSEKVRITNEGKVGIGITNPSDMLHVVGSGRFIKTSNNYVHIGSSNAGGAAIVLDGDSNGDGIGADYAYIEHDTSGDLNIVVDNPANAGNIKFWTNTSEERLRILSDGAIRIPDGSNTTSRLLIGSGAGALYVYHDGNTKFENATGYLKLQCNDKLYIDGSELFFRNAGGTNRWRILTTGHLVPGAAGTYDIGSTSAEIGDIFIADDKKVFLGSDQDFTLHHNNAHAIIKNTTGRLYVLSDDLWFKNQGDNSDLARFINGDSVILYYAGNPKLQTHPTGITVTGKVMASGEIEASQDYPNFRPTLDFNFAATKKLDPRITYRRTGPASFVNKFGKVVLVGDNAPRFDHDPTTRECKGLLIEESRTNLLSYSIPNSSWQLSSATITENAGIAPDGTNTAVLHSDNNTNNQHLLYTTATVSNATNYVITSYLKQPSSNSRRYYSLTIHGLAYVIFDVQNGTVHNSSGTGIQGASITAVDNGWYRVKAHYVTTSTNGNIYWLPIADDGANVVYTGTGQGMLVWGCQLEQATYETSYIPTNGATATRGYEATTLEGTEFSDVFGTEFKEFSLVADYDNTQTVDGTGHAIIDLWGEAGGYDDRIEWFKNSASPYHLATRAFGQGNPTFANGTADASSKAKTQRFATSWYVPDYSNTSSRRFVVSMGGEAVDVINDSSGTTVPQITRMGIGCNPTRLDFSPGLLHFKRLMVYNKTLSDGQLQNLSAQ